MLQFFLGLIVGFTGLWLTSHEKMRLEIYTQKAQAYLRLQRAAAEFLNCYHSPPGPYDPDQNKGTEEWWARKSTESFLELNKAAHETLLFANDDVFEKTLALSVMWGQEERDQDDSGSECFHDLVHAMRKDLAMKRLHRISLLLANFPGKYLPLKKPDKQQADSAENHRPAK